MHATRPLEPAGAELRALLGTVTEYLVDLVDRLPHQPVRDDDGVPELLADPSLRRPPPEHGRPLPDLLAQLDHAASKGINSASPGLMAYTPGSGLVSSAVAGMLAGVLNRFTGQAAPAPGLVAMEADIIDWLADLFGMPADAAGVLTTGASVATLSAVITARNELRPKDGTVYVTEHTHLAFAKAVRLAGFPADAVRMVPTDSALRMDPAALRAMIASDRAAGRTPFCIAATAGSTNAGTIDPLPQLADLAAAEGIWFHIDAASGGFFQLTERGRQRLRGIEQADSLALDPHKGLFLPFGTGCLLVRDGTALRAAHTIEAEAAYLQDLADLDLPDFTDLGIELSRDFRGLRLWLPLHLHGVAAFRDALDEKLDLTEQAYAALSSDPRLEVLQEPTLSTIAFRVRGSDPATTELLDRVNAEQRILLSSTVIDGRRTARICILNHRTDAARVSEALDAISRALRLPGTGIAA